MSPQLDLEFLTPERVTIRISGRPPVTRDFVNPLTPTDLFNLSWYVETFGTDGGFREIMLFGGRATRRGFRQCWR